MTDPDTPKALRVIANAMREPLYQTDMHGIEALVLDNAADEIELLGKCFVEANAENEKVRKNLHISHMYILSCQLWDDFDKYSRGKRLEGK
jgi:hypothetical protein